jgi:MFS family permease
MAVFRTLRYRNYRLFFVGQSISLVGTQLQLVAMSWLGYRLTHSAAMLGLIAFVTRVPTFFSAPFAGVVVDRTRPRDGMLVTQTLALLEAAALAVLAIGGWIRVWHIFALGVCLGVVNGFDVPLRQALIYEVVDDKEELANALALNTSMVNGANLVGPVVAGGVVAAVGEGWCFALNAVSFLAVLAGLGMMRLPDRRLEPRAGRPLGDFAAGCRAVLGNRPLRDVLLLLAMVSLAGLPHQVLLPVFAQDVLHGDARTYGWLGALSGAGALIGTLYLASRTTVLDLERSLALAVVAFGAGLVAFAGADRMANALPAMALVGLGSAIQITGCATLIQTLAEDSMRGRVMAFYTMAFMGMTPFGGLAYGWVAARVGAPEAVFLGGCICLSVGTVFFWRLPRFRKRVLRIYRRKSMTETIARPGGEPLETASPLPSV